MNVAAPRFLLDDKRSADVLRYWGALLKYQEALSARPRARPARADQRAAEAPNLLEPAPGQDYMKLPYAGSEAFLVERKGALELELRDERVGFFEDWLAQRYRPAEESEGQVSHLVLFPAVHLPRAELAGVLRFPAEVTWRAGERAFTPPTAAERGQRRLPEPPTHLRLAQPSKDPEQTLPFFVDTRLLRDTLHVGAEELDAFFAELRRPGAVSARDMIVRLCALLERDSARETGRGDGSKADAGAAELLARLHAAVQARLEAAGARSRVYPVALVVNGERARATWHVQRDIDNAIGQLESGELAQSSPLRAYLRGESPAPRRQVCLGRWPRAPLTQSQRSALELALGGSFAAIQGPPGSGKTTLILNAVVHHLIEKVRTVAEQGVMGEDILVVTSTNNRAVDNVIDPLCTDELADNPLALRVGSREVTEQVTPRTLERTLAWLQRQPPAGLEGDLGRAKRDFMARREEVEALTASMQKAYAARAELERLKGTAAGHGSEAGLDGVSSEVAAKEATLGADALDVAADRVRAALRALTVARAAAPAAGAAPQELAEWQRAPGKAQHEVRQVVRALEKLSDQSEAATRASLKRVALGVERLNKGKLSKASAALGVELALPLPPAGLAESTERSADDLAAQAELWEDALETSIGRLSTLEEALSIVIAAPARAAQLEQHAARISALEAELQASPALDGEDTPELRRAHEALYIAALELRAAWMREHRVSLEKSLQLAISQCRRTRSIKSLLDSPRGAGAWIRQLYPAFGCTLLSLGNAFDADSVECARVIIDEAGQCHAAYAVSALVRARSALVLGDVHQLEPVVGLSQDDERRIRRGLKVSLDDERLAPFRVFDESGNSAQSLADRALPSRPTLRDHFRCQPDIIALSEAWCSYGMTVRTPRRSRSEQAPELSSAVLFAPIGGEQQPFAGSWVNPLETDALVSWVLSLLARGIAPADIGVITPFRAQSEALLRGLRAARVPVETARDDVSDENLSLFAQALHGGVALGTVHRFQGGERSIMLFSTTVTRRTSLRFVDERVNLLNVATSRAKEHLVVIGHEATLTAGRHTAVLVNRAQRVSS